MFGSDGGCVCLKVTLSWFDHANTKRSKLIRKMIRGIFRHVETAGKSTLPLQHGPSLRKETPLCVGRELSSSKQQRHE